MPIPVALCITELNRGGAELALCEIAVRLDRSRFTPVVYSLQPRPHNEAVSCVPMLEREGIDVHFLDIRGGGSLLAGFWKLRRLLKRQKPLIFQSFLFHANLLGRLAAYSAGVPHRFCGIRVAEKQARWHLTLDRWTSSLVEHYVAVSQAVADFSVKTGRLPEKKISVIPNGVDTNLFLPGNAGILPATRQAGCLRSPLRSLFVGRLHPQKGIDWLLETCPHWLAQLPDWELWLVGGGNEEHLRQYEAIRNSLGDLQERIHFSGWREDIPALLADTDLLLLPSRWEGMPNVVLQGMSCGLPVLATNVEGVTEIFGEDLADPQTVPFGETRQWSEKILNIANHPEFAAELGRKNRLRVQEEFSLENMVRRYEQLWQTKVDQN